MLTKLRLLDGALPQIRWLDTFRQLCLPAKGASVRGFAAGLTPISDRRRSRAAEHAWKDLDDSVLKDIGLTRADLHAAAYGLLDSRSEPSQRRTIFSESAIMQRHAVRGAC